MSRILAIAGKIFIHNSHCIPMGEKLQGSGFNDPSVPGALISELDKMYVKPDKTNDDLYSAISFLKIPRRLLV